MTGQIEMHVVLVEAVGVGAEHGHEVRAGRVTREMQDIAALQAQLQYVSAPPPPVFSGISGSGRVNDPGLQAHGAPAPPRAGAQSIHVNLPNINRITNENVRQITDAIANEMERRARRG